jgi:hypothetical protein
MLCFDEAFKKLTDEEKKAAFAVLAERTGKDVFAASEILAVHEEMKKK